MLASVAKSLGRAFETFGPPGPDMRYDMLKGTTKRLSSRLMCYSKPEQQGKDVGCRVAFQSPPYDRKKKAITDFVLDYLSGRLETGWCCYLRERKGYVYSITMHSQNTFASGGIVYMCMVSRVDTLRLFREWGDLLVDALKNGVFHKSRHRFTSAKRNYIARQKVQYDMDVHSTLSSVTEDALYSSQNIEAEGVDFCLAHERLKIIEAADLEDVEQLAYAFLSRPVVFMLGNSNSKLSSQEFEVDARKNVSELLRRLPSPEDKVDDEPLSPSPSLDTQITDICVDR